MSCHPKLEEVFGVAAAAVLRFAPQLLAAVERHPGIEDVVCDGCAAFVQQLERKMHCTASDVTHLAPRAAAGGEPHAVCKDAAPWRNTSSGGEDATGLGNMVSPSYASD